MSEHEFGSAEGLLSEESVPVNPWAAIFSVLWSPRAVFAMVRQRSPVAPAYLFHMVVGLVVGIATALNSSRFQGEMLQQIMQRPGMTEEAARSGMGIATGTAWVVALLGGLGGPWVSGVLLALFLMLFGLLIRADDRPTFGQYFSAVGYIRIPISIGMLISLPLVYAAGSLKALQSVGSALSAAAFALHAPPFFMGVLGQISPFVIWEYVLIVVALAGLYRTHTSRTTMPAALLWLLGAVVMGGFAALGAAITQMTTGMQPK